MIGSVVFITVLLTFNSVSAYRGQRCVVATGDRSYNIPGYWNIILFPETIYPSLGVNITNQLRSKLCDTDYSTWNQSVKYLPVDEHGAIRKNDYFKNRTDSEILNFLCNFKGRKESIKPWFYGAADIENLYKDRAEREKSGPFEGYDDREYGYDQKSDIFSDIRHILPSYKEYDNNMNMRRQIMSMVKIYCNPSQDSSKIKKFHNVSSVLDCLKPRLGEYSTNDLGMDISQIESICNIFQPIGEVSKKFDEYDKIFYDEYSKPFWPLLPTEVSVKVYDAFRTCIDSQPHVSNWYIDLDIRDKYESTIDGWGDRSDGLHKTMCRLDDGKEIENYFKCFGHKSIGNETLKSNEIFFRCLNSLVQNPFAKQEISCYHGHYVHNETTEVSFKNIDSDTRNKLIQCLNDEFTECQMDRYGYEGMEDMAKAYHKRMSECDSIKHWNENSFDQLEQKFGNRNFHELNYEWCERYDSYLDKMEETNVAKDKINTTSIDSVVECFAQGPQNMSQELVQCYKEVIKSLSTNYEKQFIICDKFNDVVMKVSNCMGILLNSYKFRPLYGGMLKQKTECMLKYPLPEEKMEAESDDDF